MHSGEKLRQKPSQGPSPPSFRHFPTRPGAVPGSLQIKGQSRLVNYNLSPLEALGRVFRATPPPTPPPGLGRGSSEGNLLALDQRFSWGLGGQKVNKEDAAGTRNNWGYSFQVASDAVKASSENKLAASASPGLVPGGGTASLNPLSAHWRPLRG